MTDRKLRLGLLGGGSIAGAVVAAVNAGIVGGVEIVGVVGSSMPPSARTAATASAAGVQAYAIHELLALGPDWVLEAAGAGSLARHMHVLADSPTNLIVMSIGALLDDAVWRAVEDVRRKGRRVVLPSGAIGGLDAVAALNARGDVSEVRITTRKVPASLAGAPYVVENQVVLSTSEVSVVFDGTAADAVRGFPANVNVAAALSLAGIGPERTMVRLVSDPLTSWTEHEIFAQGPSGTVSVTIRSAPSRSNPKSSELAALSAIATLQSLV